MTGVWVEHVTSGKKVQDSSDRPRCTVLQVGYSFTDVFGEGTQVSRRHMVTYCPNVGAGGGCC